MIAEGQCRGLIGSPEILGGYKLGIMGNPSGLREEAMRKHVRIPLIRGVTVEVGFPVT